MNKDAASISSNENINVPQFSSFLAFLFVYLFIYLFIYFPILTLHQGAITQGK